MTGPRCSCGQKSCKQKSSATDKHWRQVGLICIWSKINGILGKNTWNACLLLGILNCRQTNDHLSQFDTIRTDDSTCRNGPRVFFSILELYTVTVFNNPIRNISFPFHSYIEWSKSSLCCSKDLRDHSANLPRQLIRACVHFFQDRAITVRKNQEVLGILQFSQKSF